MTHYFRLPIICMMMLLVATWCCGQLKQEPLQLISSVRTAVDAQWWDVAEHRIQKTIELLGKEQSAQRFIDQEIAPLMVETSLALKKPEQALLWLKRIQKADDSNLVWWQALAKQQLNQTNETIPDLKNSWQSQSDRSDLKIPILLTYLCIKENNFHEAEQVLSEILSSPLRDSCFPSPIHEYVLECWLDSKQFQRAGDYLAQIASNLPAEELQKWQFWKAKIAYASGKSEQAASILKAIFNNPKGLDSSMLLQSEMIYVESLKQLNEGTQLRDFLFQKMNSLLNEDAITDSYRHFAVDQLVEWLQNIDEQGAQLVLDQCQVWKNQILSKALQNVESSRTYQPFILNSAEPEMPVMLLNIAWLQMQAWSKIKTQDFTQVINNHYQKIITFYPVSSRKQQIILWMAQRWHQQNQQDSAQACLYQLDVKQLAPQQQAEYHFLQGMISAEHQQDVAKSYFESAARVFEYESQRSAAVQNALLLAISTNNTKNTSTLSLHSAAQEDIDLEKAILSSVESTELLKQFISNNLNHPRIQEARLILAMRSLEQKKPNITLAEEQFELLKPNLSQLNQTQLADYYWIDLKLSELKLDFQAFKSKAQTWLQNYPQSTYLQYVEWSLAQYFYENGDYNQARLLFEKIANNATDPSQSQVAWLLAARSANSIATSQSQQESLQLFDRAIAIDGNLKGIAIIEKAREWMDLNYYEEAKNLLQNQLKIMDSKDALRTPFLILLGECSYVLGLNHQEQTLQSIGLFDQLLKEINNNDKLSHRLQYWRGMLLEQMPHAEKVGEFHTTEALDAYLSVIEKVNKNTSEWDYAQRCITRAGNLLVQLGQTKAAVELLEKMAKLPQAQADQFYKKAQELRLKYMIW